MSVKFSSRPALIVVDVKMVCFSPIDCFITLTIYLTGFKLPPYAQLKIFPPLNPVIGNIASIIQAFRAASFPVIHISHDSLEESSPLRKLCPEGYATMPEAVGDEIVFVKHVNSSFIGTGLEAHLRAAKIDTLVILGLTTSHCVSTTTRMAGNFGFTVFLPRDATAMFELPAAPGNSRSKRFDAETMHEVALAELHEEFATVVTTEEIIAGVKGHVNV